MKLSAHPILSWLIPLLAVSTLALGIWFGFHEFGMPQDSWESTPVRATVLPNPRALKPFSLSDHAGERFSHESLRENWTFIAFGYTLCPDICPTTLAVLSQTAHLLDQDAQGSRPQFIFVSVFN